MQDFGKVRSAVNPQDDLDYAMAIGDMDSQIASQQSLVNQNKEAHSSANASYVLQYEKVYGGHCAREYSLAGRRAECQAGQNAWLITYKNRLATALAKLKNSQVQLQALRDQKAAEIAAIATLADQGLTPEAVLIQASSVAQATLQAQASKSKSKRRLVVGLIVIAVGLTAFMIIRAIRKKTNRSNG